MNFIKENNCEGKIIVLFSHGGFGLPSDMYLAMLENLASHGYIVAAIDHFYFNALTLYKSGKVVTDQTLSARFNKMNQAEQKAFVYLYEIDPSIKTSVRYSTKENFLATPVDGYKRAVVILTRQAAEALKKVQEDVKKDGYELIVYDGYRPQQAVNHFIRWAENVADQAKKSHYYPRVGKERVFELGYVAEKSGHSRGSTIDLTIKQVASSLHEIQTRNRTLKDGFSIIFLDDGTVDMGSSFDLFDVASHYENNLIEQEYKDRRTYLKNVMEKHGFKNYAEEWWHFTLRNEPHPADKDDSYFDFPVE